VIVPLPLVKIPLEWNQTISAAVDEPEDQRQNDADKQTGGQGEIEAEVFAFEIKVSRETADPGERPFSAQHEQEPHPGQDQADDQQNLSKS
jgi:hypothetical protein